MARTNPLDDPDFAELVAAAFAAGMNRQEMCDEFDVKDRSTITRWKKHPTVKRILSQMLRDRVTEVNRRVDAVIAQRLQDMSTEMTTRELLDIRKEYKGSDLVQGEKADDETINAANSMSPEEIDAAEAELERLLGARG